MKEKLEFDVSKGPRYTGHTLKVIDKNGVRYYEIGHNENSHAMVLESFNYSKYDNPLKVDTSGLNF